MMDKFSHILQWMPTGDASSSRSHFGGTAPFKVQVNFDIPIIEVQIDVYVADKWLNLLEGYFSVHNFSERENITFPLLKATPMSRTSGKIIVRDGSRNPFCFYPYPLQTLFQMLLRNNMTLLGAMMTSTYIRIQYDNKGIKMCMN